MVAAAEMTRESPIIVLNRELPINDAVGPTEEFRPIQQLGRRKERFDDIAAGFRITG